MGGDQDPQVKDVCDRVWMTLADVQNDLSQEDEVEVGEDRDDAEF